MADIWFDVDVAIGEAPVNLMPLIDDTDFKTIENAVVFNAAGLTLLWHFVTTVGVMTETAVVPTSAGVHDWGDQGVSGLYALEIPASAGTINNDTEGFGWFTGVATGVLPWRGPVIGFRAAALNNALIDGGDVLDVNLTEYLGTAVTGTLITADEVGMLYRSVISTVTSQTEFIMTDAFAVDDAWIGCAVVLKDDSSGLFFPGNEGKATSIYITDVVQSTNTIIISTAFPVTVTTSDSLLIYNQQHPMYALTQWDAATTAEVGAVETNVLADLLSTAKVLARSDAATAADESTKIDEINSDGGSGIGDFDNTADALEAIQDDVTQIPTAGTQWLESGVIDQVIYFKGPPSLSTFAVSRSRDGSAPVVMTTPTISAIDAFGGYSLLLDEDTSMAAGNSVEVMNLYISASGWVGTHINVILFDGSEALTHINTALDTVIAELGVGAPTATPTLRTGLMLLYMALRNRRDTTASSDEIHNNAGTVIASAVVSDDTVTFSKAIYL